MGLKITFTPTQQSNFATQLIGHLPTIFLPTVLMLLGLTGAIYLVFKGQKRIPVYSFLARLPLLDLCQIYLTAYYAREWGNMIGQGLELSQIFQIMQEQRSVYFRKLARIWVQTLQNGQEFSDKVASYPFQKRLSLIIEYGEVKSKLGSELEIYALKTWEGIFSRGQSDHESDSALVFVFVALMIVLLYAAMLLPFIKIWRFIYEQIKKLRVKAFTLVEMLVVLLIISVLMLIRP